MIKIEKTKVFGWEAAIRGMRNPMNSWDKSDTNWLQYYSVNNSMQRNFIGDNDLGLMQRLSKAGNDHAKFLRMINVTMDITAPLYWWKEFDTYKVGTVTNSCSTMHKIHSKEFTMDDFSHEHLLSYNDLYDCNILWTSSIENLQSIIATLNFFRRLYIETNSKEYWWQMIQLLPSSYNQKRTVQLNYQVLKNMYHARKAHKLDEWIDFCNEISDLPYFDKLCVYPVQYKI